MDAIGSIDVDEELTQSTDQIDSLIENLQLDDVGDEIEAVRTSPGGSTVDISDTYGNVESMVARESNLVMNRLMTNAGDLNEGGRLISTIRVLEETATARQALSAEINLFYALQFTGQSVLGATHSVVSSSNRVFDARRSPTSITSSRSGHRLRPRSR